MSASERLVIIGGDAAGMSAAMKVRREQPQRDILVLERGLYTSYSACGMPYHIGGLVEDHARLVARSPEEFRGRHHIDVRTRHEVTVIDPRRRQLRILQRDLRIEIEEPYDQLLIATGALPFCPKWPGSDAEGIYGLSTLTSGLKVARALEDRSPRRGVVVGGGYIGLEMAEALVRRGLEVALVHSGPEVMGTLDPDMGALVSEALRQIGVTLYLDEAVTGFETSHGRVKGVVTEHRTLPADIVILGMGTVPNTQLAEAAEIPLGVRGAIHVDRRQRTAVDGIWAAGDCAESYHRVSRRQAHIALGTVANRQGRVAGINLAGGEALFPGVVGTAVSKICRYEVARTGLQTKELDELRLDYDSVRIDSRTRAGYYPGAGRITVKLLFERGTGRLLGGQIVGDEGAAKRIDVLATALMAEMTVQQIVDLDLSYAPPFSPVWDPVQQAALQALKKI